MADRPTAQEEPPSGKAFPGQDSPTVSRLNGKDYSDRMVLDGDRDGRRLLARLQNSVFTHLDSQALRIAREIEDRWTDDQIDEAFARAVAAQRKKVSAGERIITAPLAYMRSILAGADDEREAAKEKQRQDPGYINPAYFAGDSGERLQQQRVRGMIRSYWIARDKLAKAEDGKEREWQEGTVAHLERQLSEWGVDVEALRNGREGRGDE